MKQAAYRGYTICYNLENGTGFWNAKGRIEFYARDTLCAVNMAGTVDQFTSQEAAENEFIAEAKKWIDTRENLKQPA